MIDFTTALTNVQISFGIAVIAFLLMLHVTGIFRRHNRKK